jgi:hypothetical protein
MSAALANSVDEEDLGVAGGAQQMIASLGIVVGTQIMVTVQQANAATGVTDSYELAFLVGAAAAVLGILCASFVRPTTTRSAPGPSASTDQHESAASRSRQDRTWSGRAGGAAGAPGRLLVIRVTGCRPEST